MKRFLSTLLVFTFVFVSVSVFAAEKTYNWRLVTTWTTGIPFYNTIEHFAATVDKLSEGQLKIKIFPAGAIVPAFQVFDAVRNGVAEMGHDWPGYWRGKNEAFVAFASVPFGMNSLEYTIWLQNEGMKVANELYGKFGLVPFMGGNPGQELGFFTKKPVNKLEDMAGMKVRTVGWAAEILKKLNVSVSPLPGGEIYLAFERGVLDAAEFSTPSATYPMGFQEIAKNAMVPGWHQTSCQNMFMVNKKSYDSLPDHLKYVIDIASRETQLWEIAQSEWVNADSVAKYEKEGVKFNKLTPETLNTLRKATKEYLTEIRAKNPDLDKVLGSQEAFIANYAKWKNLKSGVSAYPYDEYAAGNHVE